MLSIYYACVPHGSAWLLIISRDTSKPLMSSLLYLFYRRLFFRQLDVSRNALTLKVYCCPFFFRQPDFSQNVLSFTVTAVLPFSFRVARLSSVAQRMPIKYIPEVRSKMCGIVNNSADDFSISLKFCTGFGHVIPEQKFKVKRSKVKVTARRKGEQKFAKLWITQPWIVRFRSNLLQAMITWHQIYHKLSRSTG